MGTTFPVGDAFWLDESKHPFEDITCDHEMRSTVKAFEMFILKGLKTIDFYFNVEYRSWSEINLEHTLDLDNFKTL